MVRGQIAYSPCISVSLTVISPHLLGLHRTIHVKGLAQHPHIVGGQEMLATRSKGFQMYGCASPHRMLLRAGPVFCSALCQSLAWGALIPQGLVKEEQPVPCFLGCWGGGQ